MHGDPKSHGERFVDIKSTVPFQNKLLILKRFFQMAVNKTFSTTIRVTLLIYRVVSVLTEIQ